MERGGDRERARRQGLRWVVLRVYKGVASRKAREREKERRERERERGCFEQLCTREGVISISALGCGVTKFSRIFLQDNNPVSRAVYRCLKLDRENSMGPSDENVELRESRSKISVRPLYSSVTSDLSPSNTIFFDFPSSLVSEI